MDFEALFVDLLKMNKSVGVMFFHLLRDLHELQLCLRVSYHYMVEKWICCRYGKNIYKVITQTVQDRCVSVPYLYKCFVIQFFQMSKMDIFNCIQGLVLHNGILTE